MKALLVVSTPSQIPDVKRLAIVLKTSGKIEPIVAFNFAVDHESRFYLNFARDGITCFDYGKGILPSLKIQTVHESVAGPTGNVQLQSSEQLMVPPQNTFKNYLKTKHPKSFHFLKTAVFLSLRNVLYKIRSTHVDFFAIVFKIINRRRKERALLRSQNISLVILCEDSVDYYTSGLVQVAQQEDVKVFIFPYTLSGSLEFLVDAHFNKLFVSRGIMNRISGFFFPKWVAEFRGKRLVKSRPALIWAHQLFGRTPPNPWIMNSGFSDFICVESQFMLDYFKRVGVEPQKLQIFGFPVLDEISAALKAHEIMRNQLSQTYDLDLKKPWVLCSMPPNQFPRKALQVKEYAQILERYFGCFADFENEIEVIFQFHPRANANEYKPICQKLGIRPINKDIASLIPLADIFVASVSSTIRWALACGLSVINFDIYEYNYKDFESSGVKTIFTKDEFKAELRKLITGQLPVKPNSYYGELSGQVSEKMVTKLLNMTKEKK